MSSMLGLVDRFFVYDDWANRESLDSLRGAGEPPEKGVRYLAHILAARRLWLERVMEKKDPAVVVWPERTLDECAAELEDLSRCWREYLEGMSESDLSRRVVYRNSLGEEYTNSVEDILLHMSIHGGYHRGQIASLLRASGGTPVYTDYIVAVRKGHVPEAP